MKSNANHLLNIVALGVAMGSFACDSARTEVNVAPSPAATTQSANSEGKTVKTDEEWKKILTPNQFYILRQKGTEPPFRNEYWNNHEKGDYVCAADGNVLYHSDTKFDSGTGWPSFWQPVEGSVDLVPDADGSRVEVVCHQCGGHLGHVFDDGPAPTGKRYCMDSGAMKFIPKK